MKIKKYKIPLLIIVAVSIILFVGLSQLYKNTTLSTLIEEKPKVGIETQVVELKNGDTFNLTATKITKKIGAKEVEMLAYNGSVPGPMIHVKQGSEVTIVFKNETNDLQLLHSHGVRMENKYDGSQLVQKEMKPGETFEYKLTFPDVGIYWYHPHVNEVVGQALGLYGAFVVSPSDDSYYSKVNKEETLFLSDLPMEDGKVAINGEDHALMGHYGNVMLINGKSDYSLSAKVGEVVRLYVVNSANTRPFNFTINGAKMKLVGGDSGAYEKEFFVKSVLLAPSERAIIDVYFPTSGSFTMTNDTPNGNTILGNVVVDSIRIDSSYEKEFLVLKENKDTIKSIDTFRPYFNKSPDKQIKLTISSNGMMGNSGGMMNNSSGMMGGMDTLPEDGIEWDDSGMMNNMMTTKNTNWQIVDTETGKTNMDINWEFEKGKPVVIRILNDKNSMHPMQHPIHFHGQRFLVIRRNGVEQTNLVWKDTTLVRIGETVDIVLDPSNEGSWMSHCHISEHLASGMMFGFKVIKK